MDDIAAGRKSTIAIVGGGAAGLAAAIFAGEAARGAAARRRPRIVLLDGAKRLGAKILVAGGGRCNVTHHAVGPEDFQGNRNIVRNVLRAFPVADTEAWFASLGVDLKREASGKLFPTTDNARTVLDALLARCRALDVELRCDHRVHRVAGPAAPREATDPAAAGAESPAFTLHHAHGSLTADRLILATGGRSLPKSGSDGGGYALARELGHTVTATHASLVPLVLHESFFHADLSGVSQSAALTTFVDGKKVDRRSGSLLWTHFGISGPLAMDASRFWTVAQDAGRRPVCRLSLLPELDFARAEAHVLEAARARPRRPLAELFSDRLPGRVLPALLAHLGLDPAGRLAELSKADRRRLVHGLTDLELPVSRHRGWNHAEVTAGGVPLGEIDHRTMASRRCPGLHLIGEILDCDGRIGGFNFQWAWATGKLAGEAAGA